ncbi:MAG: hypothetical protein R2800_09010 [Flavipsychrobacter sp.]
MKKLLSISILAGLIGMSSCSEDFEVAAPYRQITFAYGMLDKADTAHYIRIQKAFMDENKSAIDMSKVPDSSFYQQLNVRMLEYSGTTLTATYPLTKVDLNKEGYTKASSVNQQSFFTSPNNGYKFKADLKTDRSYRLLITNTVTGRTDSTDNIGIVSNDTNSVTAGFYVNEFNKAGLLVDFARTTVTSKLDYFVNTPANSYTLEGILRFHYEDRNILTNTKTRKTVDYAFATLNVNPSQAYTPSVLNNNIYSYLRDAIGVAPANVERYMDSCDIIFYAGSKELANYNTVMANTSNGLTNDIIQPNYTNMVSKDAFGIIGSKASRTYISAGLSFGTMDSLKNLPIVKPLNIRGRTDD